MIAIATELAVAFLIFLLGIGFRGYLYPWYLRLFNPLRSIMPFGLFPDRIHVGYGLIPPGAPIGIYTVEEGDARTMYEIDDILSHLYQQDKVIMRSHIDLGRILDVVENLVTVSGPKWNKLTERAIGQLGSPVTFDKFEEISRLVFQGREGDPVYYETDREPGQLARICHGIILSGATKRTTGLSQSVLVCAGNSTLSSYGVGLFLRNCINNKELVKSIRAYGITPKSRWGLIVEVKSLRTNGGLSPLAPSEVQVKIVRRIRDEEFVDPYEYRYSF